MLVAGDANLRKALSALRELTFRREGGRIKGIDIYGYDIIQDGFVQQLVH